MNVAPYNIADKQLIGGGRLLLRLAALGESLNYLPGQYIQLHFNDGPLAYKRSFSIASIALRDRPDEFELVIDLIPGGRASELLQAANVGQTLDISGPYGKFVLSADDQNQRYVMIATGTGVAPFRSMLVDLVRWHEIEPRVRQVLIVCGDRSPDDMLFKNELREFGAKASGRGVLFSYSRHHDGPLLGDERRGRVQQILGEISANPVDDIFYLCGNADMVDDMYHRLRKRGFRPRDVRRERYVESR